MTSPSADPFFHFTETLSPTGQPVTVVRRIICPSVKEGTSIRSLSDKYRLTGSPSRGITRNPAGLIQARAATAESASFTHSAARP